MKRQELPLVRLAIVGIMGRMGQRIAALAFQDPRFQIMAGVERPSSAKVGRFLSDGKTPVVGDIREVLPKVDAVIDFSQADSVSRTAQLVASRKKSLVIGTTGLTPKAVKDLKKLSRRIPIVFSPNMSVGVNVLFNLIEKAASALADYDIEIIEAHHSLKKDSPSGTAAKLAEIAAASSGRSSKDFVYGRHGLVGTRSKKEIGILSVRAGDIVGDHTVLLSSAGERLELTHRAHSRDAFAAGALKAALWLKNRRAGLYTMQDVLKNKS